MGAYSNDDMPPPAEKYGRNNHVVSLVAAAVSFTASGNKINDSKILAIIIFCAFPDIIYFESPNPT
jgi:hypothetical protein